MGNLVKTLAVNTGSGIVITALQYLYIPADGQLLSYLAINMIYSHVIGSAAAVILPRVGGRIWHLPPRRMWSLFVGCLLLIAVVGTAVSVAALWATGYVRTSEVAIQYWRSVKIAILITQMVGIGSFFFHSFRARFEKAALQLKEQQLVTERTQKLAFEARLSSLQSRLHPHFLFNTINSIQALIRENPAGAEIMLQRLSRLLRYALDTQERTTVALGDELKLLTDYLEIEQMRFGQRLRFSIDVPAGLHNVELPPYALQTLVENAMKHVVARRREGGRIDVSAHLRLNSLVVEVRDDGDGFELDDIPPGHGLDTLIARLVMLYDGRGALEVQSLQPGCVARLTVPFGGGE